MSNRNNDESKISITRIETSDTISQFMEKCNNNFSNLLAYGGGTVGAQGEHGDQGVPTKPKVPIHIWIQKGEEHDEEYHYITEESTSNNEFEITSYTEDLSKAKYQEGHLIILQNAHVYSLENDGGVLKPKFKLALQSYDKNNVIDGKNAYVHIAYSNTPTPTSREDFVTDQQLREENNNTEPVETYSLKRSATTYSTSTTNMDYAYMGIYSDNTEKSSVNPSRYTWVRIQGQQGIQGIQGEQGQQGIQGIRGEQGDAFTGQPFSIDLSGDMSTLSLDTNGRSLYNDGSNDCKCTLHAYYGKEKHKLSFEQDLITITPPSSDYDIIKPDMTHAEVVTKDGTKVGDIQMYVVDGNIDITFRPDSDFDFLKKTIPFTIGVGTIVHDSNDNKKYTFTRNTIWIIKGIVSDFKLEIIPSHRTIKKLEGGSYYPESLQVNVYKTSGEKREPFNDIYSKDSEFKLLYKDYNDTNWLEYTSTIHKTGISTSGHSCLEFKVVRYPGENEEIWDYEDVWVVADGKGTHYYHADLGSTESMMVLTTGIKKTETINGKVIEYTELRNKDGYSITFNPKFYDGTEELTVSDINIGSNSGEAYYTEGSFVRNLTNNTLTITRVPYGVEVIPMTFDVWAEDNKYRDTVAFNVYISTIADLYTLVPSVSSYNTSTGSSGDTIGCDVYKNNIKINQSHLKDHNLELTYILHSEKNTQGTKEIVYTEPIGYSVDDGYGEGNDTTNDIFTASDVAIEFILYCNNKAVVRSSVPLIKDGINGADGDCWQYIFFKTCYDKFDSVVSVFGNVINPKEWKGESAEDNRNNNSEYLGTNDIDYTDIKFKDILPWTDNPSGVDIDNRYEYQSYRKWDKVNHCWGKYGDPTLYSTYSVDGAPGVSAVHMELSQDYIAVPLDPITKKVHILYDEKISTKILLYEGSKLINDGISYSFEINNIIYDNNVETSNEKYTKLLEDNIPIINEDNGEFEFHKSLFSKDTYIKCIATYKKERYEKTLFVDLEETPYELELKLYKGGQELNNNIIFRDVNTGELLVDKIEAYLKCWSNGEWSYISSWGSIQPMMSIIGYGENLPNGSLNLLNGWLYTSTTNSKTCFVFNNSHDKFNENFKHNTKLDSIELSVWGYPNRELDSSYKKLTYENIGIINNKGERGGSGYGVLLSNPISVIPVGDDWKTDENVENQYDSTLVYLYGNSTDVSKQITIDIIPDNSDDDNLKHFSTTKDDSINKVVFTPVVEINGVDHAFDFGSNAQYKLPIEIKYPADNNFTTTTNWTLTPIRGLEDVEVYVDKRTVNTTTQTDHTLNVGYYLTTPNGVKTLITNAGKNTKGYNIILTYNTQDLDPKNEDVIKITNNSTWSATYSFVKNNENRNCYVVLVDKDNNILDYTEVMAVSDGADGTSAVHLELTQDYIAVPSKPGGGGVHPVYNGKITSEMILYEGDTRITEDIDYTIAVSNSTESWSKSWTSNSGVFTITTDTILSDTTVLCSACYNNNYFYKNLIIDLEETPYELELDKNILVRDVNNNTITNSNLTVKVKYWMSGTWENATDGEIHVNNQKVKDYSNTTTIDNLSRYISDSDTEVRISYYKDGKELSYEILGIISNGMNGTNGTNGTNGDDGKTPILQNTTRIGFSLEEIEQGDSTNKEYENKWVKDYTDVVKNLDPSKTPIIYVLYKQTWVYKEDPTTHFYTYYISTTMAGTQGANGNDGKSRVLFYLGSFESDPETGKTPTLKGTTVPGTLNDTRCDYYIDESGQAWMRKGEEGTKDGSSKGNAEGTAYADYWEKADKVGFLQAGAITSDMINTGSILADTSFITNLFALKVEAKNLTVGAANITGTLEASQIKVGDIKITSAQIDGDITGKTIKSSNNSWEINYDGSGWLANKNIEWTRNGDITIKKGKIESGSTFGSWYTWNDGTISTISEGEQNSKSEAVRFSSDGSGHLCYKNISWDKDGNLFLGGLEGNEVVIGKDAWTVTSTGIKTKCNSAEFNNDGSGQIGGYYRDKNNEITPYKKGISWNESGDVYFHNRLIIKPQYITLDGTENENSYKLKFEDMTESTFIFIESNTKTSSSGDCNCYSVWISWFLSGWYDKHFNIEDNSIVYFTLINHTNKTLDFFINEEELHLPFRKSNDCILPIHNYILDDNNTFGESNNIIQTLYVLPGSKVEMMLEKHNNKNVFYINNISDFRLGYTHNDNNKFIRNLTLVSTNYDLNTFTNQGGYSKSFNSKYYDAQHGYLRLIFGNRIYAPTSIKGIIYPNINTYLEYNSTYDYVSVSTLSTDKISYTIDTTYDSNIEYIGEYGYPDEENHHISMVLNITQNTHTYGGKTTTYDKVRLICYSPQYHTTYKGNWVNITTLGENIEVSITQDDQKILNGLAINQLNGILDVFVSLDFNSVVTTD